MKEKNRPKNQCQHATKKPLFKPKIWIRKYLPKYASEVTEKKADPVPEIQFLLLSLVRRKGTNLFTPKSTYWTLFCTDIIRKDRKLTGSLPIKFATPRQKLKKRGINCWKKSLMGQKQLNDGETRLPSQNLRPLSPPLPPPLQKGDERDWPWGLSPSPCFFTGGTRVVKLPAMEEGGRGKRRRQKSRQKFSIK